MTHALQALSIRAYRLAAKATASALGRHEIVESVYVNRGVGRGEVSFGRSDIDLLLVVRTPDLESGDGPGLASLYERVRILRRVNPALGHMMVFDPRGLDRWSRTDSFLSSLERRSAILLAGKPTPIPRIPIRREDAIRWVAYWPESFFPMAVRQRNHRNLRKIATEIWKAWAVAQGIVPEPYLTQKEAEAGARINHAGAGLLGLARDPEGATEFVMKLAGLLHDELLPPLRRLQEPLIFRLPIPPRSARRVLVILPQYGSPLPAEAFEDQSFLATPELLHLYANHVNPFMDWILPAELRRLGFLTPPSRQFVRACLFYGQDNMLRLPGFVRPDTWTPGTAVAVTRYCIPYLRNGEIPPPMQEDAMRAVLEHRPTFSEYYRQDFARVYRESVEQWEVLEELEKRYEQYRGRTPTAALTLGGTA